jgi:hypothetical protein
MTVNALSNMMAKQDVIAEILFQRLGVHVAAWDSQGVPSDGKMKRYESDRKGEECPTVRIVSNRMHFDQDGSLVGFNELLIHSLNKNYGMIRSADRVESNGCDANAEKRKFVLLLGDNLGDADMSKGLIIWRWMEWQKTD